MSRDKLLILGVVVLGVLGFLVYKQQQKDSSMGQAMAMAKDFQTINAPDDIDRVSITNGDWPVTAAIGGAQTPTGMTLTVQQ